MDSTARIQLKRPHWIKEKGTKINKYPSVSSIKSLKIESEKGSM